MLQYFFYLEKDNVASITCNDFLLTKKVQDKYLLRVANVFLALEKAAVPSPTTGEVANPNASMIWRRLKVYSFQKQIPKVKQMKCCGRCFAELLAVHPKVDMMMQYIEIHEGNLTLRSLTEWCRRSTSP